MFQIDMPPEISGVLVIIVILIVIAMTIPAIPFPEPDRIMKKGPT